MQLILQTVDADEDDSFTIPGMVIEKGWPADQSRFGLGLHLRAGAFIHNDQDDENGFMFVWV